MVPFAFAPFFATCAQAGAALIGLLFLAVSIAPEETVMAGAPLERRVVAASAFTALVNVFFISIGAQLPQANVGFFVCIMGLIGLLNTIYLLRPLMNERQRRENLFRQLVLVSVSLGLYLVETWQGVHLLRHPSNVGPVYTLGGLLMGVFAVGLIRSWQLLGVRRYGLLGWLNPLQDSQTSSPPPAIVKPDSEQ
jgi:uncharacterized membrane protein